MSVILKVINKSNNSIPNYSKSGDSGMDIRANIDSPIVFKPLERKLISTGIYLEIPEGYEVQVRSRSGMTLKRALVVLNEPGTIDSNYRGEVGVILANLSNEEQYIEPGERIAQLVVSKVEHADLEVVDEISDSERGGSGYGDSGRF